MAWRVTLAAVWGMLSGAAWAQTDSNGSLIQSTVYVCEKNGVIALRNTLPTSDEQCARRTMSTRVSVRPPSIRPAATVPYYPRSWGDPQPTAQTLILGAQVPAGVQWQRDLGRRRILMSELNSAEQRLQDLNAQYRDGQPERQGNEKNYQKYLDRVEDLQQAIRLTEANIAALRRELGTVGGAP